MIIFANLLGALAFVVDSLLGMLIFVLFVSVLISWVNPDPFNPIVRFLKGMTTPLLAPIRKIIPLVGGGIDLTPLVLFMVLYFLRYFLVGTLSDYAKVLSYQARGAWYLIRACHNMV